MLEKDFLGAYRSANQPDGRMINATFDTIILDRFSLIAYEANCTFPEQWPIYSNNLCRMLLCEISDEYRMRISRRNWDAFYEHPIVLEARATKSSLTESINVRTSITGSHIWITPLGKQFFKACVQPHDSIDLASSSAIHKEAKKGRPEGSTNRKKETGEETRDIA